MARIDALIARLAASQARKAVLVANAPMRIEQADGSFATGAVITGEQLNDLLNEVLPANARVSLDADGIVTFQHNVAEGLFFFTARRSTDALIVEVTPAFAGAQAQSVTPPTPAAFTSVEQPQQEYSQPANPVLSQSGYSHPQPGYGQQAPQPNYQQPYASPPPVANDSGSGGMAALPVEARGFNWGAFLLSWIWAIGNSTWVGLLSLIPIVGFFVRFWLGFSGNELAWRNKRWSSVEAFRSAQRTWTIVGLAMWGVTFVFSVGMGGVLFPVFARARENARKASCQNNEKEISLAIAMFCSDHNDKFPSTPTMEGWKQELANYNLSPNVWKCPSHAEEGIGYELNSRMAGVSEEQIPDSSGLAIFWDTNPEQHLGGRNVAFADGHVKWFPEQIFQASVKPAADNFSPPQ